MAGLNRTATYVNRFFSRVTFPNGFDGCWIWYRPVYRGYGFFSYFGKSHRAHRVSYWLFRGEIPEGLVLDHLCRNRICVNPDHLEPVTRGENSRRGVFANIKPHCPKGHLFDEENTYIRNRYGRPTNKGRVCRACSKDRQRKYLKSRK